MEFWTHSSPLGNINSFNFMQLLGKFGKNRMLASAGGLVPPSRDPPLRPINFRSKVVFAFALLSVMEFRTLL